MSPGKSRLPALVRWLHTYLSLLGFATRSERELARKLLSVSGVGPSIALALLSVMVTRSPAIA